MEMSSDRKRPRLDLFQVNPRYYQSVAFQREFSHAFRSPTHFHHPDSGASVVAGGRPPRPPRPPHRSDPPSDPDRTDLDNRNDKDNHNDNDDDDHISNNETEGFPIGVLPSILDHRDMLDVRRHLLRQTFYRKRNDLYDFLQSEDLKCVPAGDDDDPTVGDSPSPLTRLRNTIQR